MAAAARSGNSPPQRRWRAACLRDDCSGDVHGCEAKRGDRSSAVHGCVAKRGDHSGAVHGCVAKTGDALSRWHAEHVRSTPRHQAALSVRTLAPTRSRHAREDRVCAPLRAPQPAAARRRHSCRRCVADAPRRHAAADDSAFYADVTVNGAAAVHATAVDTTIIMHGTAVNIAAVHGTTIHTTTIIHAATGRNAVAHATAIHTTTGMRGAAAGTAAG
mmetsp:Transcript_9235/g.28097  ORF Transcript_9235/g.28097 Transcript_9235/m.28097 type:complete len:217 (-) Transcript_9235:1408-2058(-)